MSRKLTLPAFAKINWILRVIGKRPDQYHELVTVLQTIDLADRIEIELTEGSGISLSVSGLEVPQSEENLVWKAARGYLDATGCREKIRLALHKVIPVGAGLGGGSADAAIVLVGLNALCGNRLSRARLHQLAADLGSDVPFFLLGGTVLARGRGEVLEPFPDPRPTQLILYYPGFQISARKAYDLGNWPAIEEAPLLTSEEVNNRILRFRRRIDRGLPVADLAENDFDGPLFEEYPEMSRVRACLKQLDCEVILFSGSGSTLLGVPSQEQFPQIHRQFESLFQGSVWAVRSLSREEYHRRLKVAGVDLEDMKGRA